MKSNACCLTIRKHKNRIYCRQKLTAASAVQVLLVWLFCLSPLSAEIYKCTEAGKAVFSDKPCSDNAEKLEITVRQPLSEDIERQQHITETFEQESRISAIKSLHQQNKLLENKIAELEQQREAELAELRTRTYRISETTIATKEHGLFQKMNAVVEHYQQQIDQVQADIRENKTKLLQLQQARNNPQ